MNSPPQLVIRNTFIEFGDGGADKDAFFLPLPLRRARSSPCLSTLSTASTDTSSQGTNSDFSESEEHLEATSDFSEPEEHLEAEDAMNEGWETASEDGIGQANPAADVAMPFVGMPLKNHTPQQYVFCCVPASAFVPMVAVPHGLQEGNMGPNHVPAQPCSGTAWPNHVPDSPPKTTIMLRNLPNDYSRKDALDLLDSHGFAGLYDFFYLPVDFDRGGSGMGYAFVNFISHDNAVKAMDSFEGFCDWTVASQKVCEVTWGDPLQGREAHEERYRNSPVMHESVADHFKPLVFEKGICVPFPPPTKRVRAPRHKPPMRRRGWY